MLRTTMSLSDLQSSPAARNRRARRTQQSIERAVAQHSKVIERRNAFVALLQRVLWLLWTGAEPDDTTMVAFARSWDPTRDEPFLEATTLLYRLAFERMRTNLQNAAHAPRLARMFELMAAIYCGQQNDVTRLRAHLLLALRHPEWRPPWLADALADVACNPPGAVTHDAPPAWLSVLGKERGAFLQGVLPRPDMRVGLSRITSGHPWAMFVSEDEFRQLRDGARAAFGRSKANDPRPKVPRGVEPWKMAGLADPFDRALVHARAEWPELADEMQAAVGWLSGREHRLAVDLPMLLAVSPVVPMGTVKHGAGGQVVRGLLASGVTDPSLLANLASVSDARVAQEKRRK